MHAVLSRARLVAAVTALVVGSTLSACGSDEPASADPTPGAESTGTPSEATDSPSEGPSDGGAAEVDQEAIDAFAARLRAGIVKTEQGHIEMTMSGAGGEVKASGDIRYTDTTPDMRMSLDLGPQSFQMVMLGGKVYMQSAQTGDKFVVFDLSDPSNPLGSEFLEQVDPTASLKTLVKAVTSVKPAGSEEVDGRDLNRFELVVDTAKLDNQQTAAQLPPTVALTVWLDDQDRIAKSSAVMGEVTVVTVLSDFDKPVHIKAPSADQIAETPTP